jgi:hypothetical protein
MDDARAVRAVAREVYRELDAATRTFPVMEQATTYRELRAALPHIKRWPALRERLANHAAEVVWLELAYQLDKIALERMRLTMPAQNAAEPISADLRDGVVRRVELAILSALYVLKVLLPSDREPEAFKQLRANASARQRKKLWDQQAALRRSIEVARTEGQADDRVRKVSDDPFYDPAANWGHGGRSP